MEYLYINVYGKLTSIFFPFLLVTALSKASWSFKLTFNI